MNWRYLQGVLLGLVSLLRQSESHIFPFDEKSCPLRLPHNFTQNHLLAQLTSPCRYNKKHTPIDPRDCAPLKVRARIHVYHLRSGSEANAEFKVQLLLQLHWRDPRLAYRAHAPHITEMVGERNFIRSIWTPHIYLTNERDSLVLGLFRRDMLVSILPDGDLLFSTRLKTTIFCWVQLGKFPFDQQKCHLIMDSWRYNASELILEWDPHPITIPASRPYLTEYHLMDTVTQVQDQFSEPSAVADANHSYVYSSLTLTFILDRQYGFYLMDFYAPSILLVCMSWVSFWMAPDAVPGRTILGASTMLTFFQLGIETGSSLPNVSYIRSNDVWFFACTVFIFLSLAEFAFVNTIWRYGDQKVGMKKATSKYILKSSVHPHLQHEISRTLSVRSHCEPLERVSRADSKRRVDSFEPEERRRSLSCQTTPELKKSLDKGKMDPDHVKSISTLDLAFPLRELNVPSLQKEHKQSLSVKNPTREIDNDKDTSSFNLTKLQVKQADKDLCFNLPTLHVEQADKNPCFNLPTLQGKQAEKNQCFNLPTLQGKQADKDPCFNLSTLHVDEADKNPCFNLPTLQVEQADKDPCFNLPTLPGKQADKNPCFNLPTLQGKQADKNPCFNLPTLQGKQADKNPCFNLPTLQGKQADKNPCFNLPTLQVESEEITSDSETSNSDASTDEEDEPHASMEDHTDLPFSQQTRNQISMEEHPKYATVMSMQDIAIWVDNKSKIVFPLAFTLFNATYWGVLYQS